MKRFAYLTLLVVATPLFAFAEGGKDPFAMDTQVYIGALGGISVPDAQYTTQRNGFGFTAGAKLSDEWGVGAFFLGSNKGERAANGASDFEFDYSTYGIEGNYLFDGSAAGAHVGARLGTAKVSKQLSSGTTYAYSPFVYGLQAGYDYMLMSHFSLGAEVSAMFFQGGAQDTTTGLVVGPFDVLNFMLVGKFWF